MENWLSKPVRVLDKVGLFSRWANMVGVIIFFFMLCLTFADVLLRYLFNHPLLGAKEITELMLVLVVFVGIAYAQIEKRHISVELVTGRLSPKVRLVVDTVTNVIGVGLFGVLSWQSLAQFLFFLEMNTQYGTIINIPRAPFMAVVIFGCVLLMLVLLRDLFHNIAEGLRLHLRGYMWLLMSGIFILAVVLAILWMQPALWQISLSTVGLIGMICFLILIFTGIPISFALTLTGFLFISHIRGTFTALDTVGTELFATPANYLWASIGFFVLMGYFCVFARFGEDLFRTAYKWIGHISGGLAIATITACTIFSAIVSSTLSVVTTMGAAALPEMRKYGYDDRLSTGTIGAGATIGPMVPPSVGFIMYGVLTEQSIGKLFIAGIIPGVLLCVAFSTIIYIQCRFRPELGPPGEKSAWGDRLVSLRSVGPVVALFLLVIGGIYAGIFTATEGGGIGAAGALIIALLMRRINKQRFYSSLLETGALVSYLFLILIGGTIFTRFAGWTNISGVLLQFLTGLALPPVAIVIIILLILLVLGFIIDTTPLLLIGVPIFHPIAVGLGYDPVWFAVVVMAIIQLGMITPPVAVVLWALKGVTRDISLGKIYRGIMPFVGATVVVVCVIFLVPQLATWLPDMLY